MEQIHFGELGVGASAGWYAGGVGASAGASEVGAGPGADGAADRWPSVGWERGLAVVTALSQRGTAECDRERSGNPTQKDCRV
jgi:hypothetical protein